MAARWRCRIGLHKWHIDAGPTGEDVWRCEGCRKVRSVDKPSSEGFADSVEVGNLLWEEYKYRHDLVWKLVFQLTTAVILINTAPYLKDNVTKGIGWPMLAVPALAIVLALLGVLRLSREHALLDEVRTRHLTLHSYPPSRGTFKRQSAFYLWCLVALSAGNLVALAFLWLPDAK
jgi:hypothetical protein